MIESIIFLLLAVAFIFILIAIMAGKIDCPFKIFSHLPLCVWYYLLDVVFTIIWFFFWLLSFFLIYLPMLIIFSFICLFYKPLCYDISIEDSTIKRLDFFLLVDTIYELMFESKFLYRDSDDIDTCYCSNSLMKLFDPLTTKLKFLDELENIQTGNNYYILIVSIVLLSILYSYNSS